ncbi:MAG: hypothetical protein U0797_22345 [Gemmataceae bacterium]
MGSVPDLTAARRDRTKGKAGGSSSLGILDLASGKVTTIERPGLPPARGRAGRRGLPARHGALTEEGEGEEAPRAGKMGKGGPGGEGPILRPATPSELVLRDRPRAGSGPSPTSPSSR